MSGDIRYRVDSELTKRVGTWFTVREIQETLRINPATLKPLLMKYARENLLRRRHVKGTARSVQFTPAAPNKNGFNALITKNMPYRKFTVPPTLKAGSAKKGATTKVTTMKKGSPLKGAAKTTPFKGSKRSTRKASPKKRS
jgi:hypothetical protein